MPILQNKLVMKSIEALHDEALALTPVSASENGVAESSPPAIIHATKSPHESPANAPATDGDDIMARIDHLLKKLDEEDDTVITPPGQRAWEKHRTRLIMPIAQPPIIHPFLIGQASPTRRI